MIYALQPSLAITPLLLIQESFSHAYAANFGSIRKTHFEWKTRWKFKGSENDNQIKKFMWFSEYLSKPQNLIYLNRTIEFSKQTKARVESFSFSKSICAVRLERGGLLEGKKGNWIFTGIIFVDFVFDVILTGVGWIWICGWEYFPSTSCYLFPSLWVSQILAFVYWKLLKVVTLDFVCWHDTDALNIFEANWGWRYVCELFSGLSHKKINPIVAIFMSVWSTDPRPLYKRRQTDGRTNVWPLTADDRRMQACV